MFGDVPATPPGWETQEDNTNCLPLLSLLKHKGQDPCTCLSPRKLPARRTYTGLNLAEAVTLQFLHNSTLQSGAVTMAVSYMEEQFTWKRDVRNAQWNRYWRLVNPEQLQRIVK